VRYSLLVLTAKKRCVGTYIVSVPTNTFIGVDHGATRPYKSIWGGTNQFPSDNFFRKSMKTTIKKEKIYEPTGHNHKPLYYRGIFF